MRKRRKLKIPASFELLGHTIEIKVFKDLRDDEGHSVYGMFDSDKNTIELTEECIDSTVGEETFCHEVMEAINAVLEMDLAHHEIQQIGAAWHQVLTTMHVPRKKKEKKHEWYRLPPVK